MIIKKDYECCRCGYKTNQKNAMRMHLNRKRVCPGTKRDITLTNDVKECILNNKSYEISKENDIKKVTNINAFIQNISHSFSNLERLKLMAEFEDIEIINLFRHIETLFHKEIHKLQNDSYKFTFELTYDDLYDIFDKISKRIDSTITTCNIIFDTDGNHVNILDEDDTWIEQLIDKGVKVVVDIVQIMYLNEYERYLLRKIKGKPMNQERQKIFENLRNYYRFISCFDLKPYCQHTDDYILNDCENSTYEIANEFEPIFISCKETLSKQERKEIQKKLCCILKSNSSRNLTLINRKFANMYTQNKQFQQTIESSL